MPGIRIPQGSRVIGASLAVGLNACLLLWVAIANGYPLLFFDSFSYLDSAHELELFIESGFRRLHDANAKLRWPGPSRSKPYELFLVTTRGNYWPWVPVAIASAAASWLLWLTVRHLRLQPATPWAVGIGLVLACLTSAPWVAGMLLPDALTAALIVAALDALLGYSPTQDELADSLALELTPAPVVGLYIATCVIAPIAEETFFRGFVFGGLRAHWPFWAAALVSSLIFGSVHLTTGPAAIPLLALLGVCFAYLYERSGSLWPAVIAHALNNALALTMQITS